MVKLKAKLIAGRGEIGDSNWGANFDRNKAKLERQLKRLKRHIGERIMLTGGGSFGKAWFGILENPRIVPFGDNALALQVTLRDLLPRMSEGRLSEDTFEPYINSWQISAIERH